MSWDELLHLPGPGRSRVLVEGLDHPEGVCWSPTEEVIYAGGEQGQVYRVGLDDPTRILWPKRLISCSAWRSTAWVDLSSVSLGSTRRYAWSTGARSAICSATLRVKL